MVEENPTTQGTGFWFGIAGDYALQIIEEIRQAFDGLPFVRI
jgi:hypothetical protein